ncbi:uncharacterized protein Tco025E_07822 [Trypanosoma conorhini]|uniref:Uncharacterized protein n=1 Tax=Trypanosoma conorhini TaxID=83891 RepID=A0A3R7KC89_9TRYP|nr:uncharacterized protein Tco025E_07822 [Trypanosoma conorhini]RNF05206.1 hypothetical protein Tco025E_07822 [Trypanosoma conorhini]
MRLRRCFGGWLRCSAAFIFLFCLLLCILLGLLLEVADDDGAVKHATLPAPRGQPGSDACSEARSCLDCLFPGTRMGASLNASHPSTVCFWCAARGRCVSRAEGAACDDLEELACPAVLHTAIPQVFRVLHVGIRKGGPEALIQLFLALHRWGFRTTLDTRRKEQGGPVVPFFRKVYKFALEHAPPLRWFKDYKAWHESALEGDVLIATETWPCVRRNHLESGVRQMQWHLTVWRRRDRARCTIAGHTNFIAMSYMNQSKLALLFPYVSPHIVQLAQSQSSWRRSKRRGHSLPLVLLDSDVKLSPDDFVGRHGAPKEVVRAAGFAPEKLYALYGEAIAGVDLQLPGAERLIFEAVLFDVCIIVDDALVGGCKQDVPLPEAFRVPSGDLDALNAAVDRCVRDYDAVIPLFRELKQFSLQQKSTFERQVRRYFSNSVHVVSVVCSREQSEAYLVRFLLNVLLYIPFATLELRLADGVEGLKEWQRTQLSSQSWLAAVRFVRMSSQDTVSVCEASNHATDDLRKPYRRPTMQLARAMLLRGGNTVLSNKQRSLLTLFAPIDAILVSEDVVHYTTSQLALLRREGGAAGAALNDAGRLAVFVLEAEAEMARNVPLVAVWTADLPFFGCGYVAHTDVTLFKKVCRHEESHLVGAPKQSRRAVVIHDDGLNLPLARVLLSRDGPDDHVRTAWEFMCQHALWKDLVGGC